MAKKKARSYKRLKKIDIDQILLHYRQIFINGKIDEKMAHVIIQKLMALDRINNEPIVVYINSPGGCVDDGFAIIDVIKCLKSPIITVIIGNACSMAGIISIAGDIRMISKHSVWMSHDMAGGIWGDYTTKVIDRAEFLKKEQRKIFQFIREHTKLSEKEIYQAITGELWLYPVDCLKKGIVDGLIGVENAKK